AGRGGTAGGDGGGGQAESREGLSWSHFLSTSGPFSGGGGSGEGRGRKHHQRPAGGPGGDWAFSQVQGPLVCDTVSILRTLLQNKAWAGVTATLLQDALARGNSCLQLLAREAADRAAAVRENPPPEGDALPQGQPLPDADAEAQAHGGGHANREGGGREAFAGRSPPEGSTRAPPEPATGQALPASQSKAEPALALEDARKPGEGLSRRHVGPAGMTGTLTRTLGALSVLGGHVDMLYTGCTAEVVSPADAIGSRGG
ncbi:unnamed protein product, partial [Discosporangium mesarthrocarpum]